MLNRTTLSTPLLGLALSSLLVACSTGASAPTPAASDAASAAPAVVTTGATPAPSQAPAATPTPAPTPTPIAAKLSEADAKAKAKAAGMAEVGTASLKSGADHAKVHGGTATTSAVWICAKGANYVCIDGDSGAVIHKKGL